MVKLNICSDNYILGGGIAGLIWGFYHRDYKIISPEFGGQMNHHFDLGPRYLYKNKYSRKFLKDLEIKFKEKLVTIGHYNNGWTSPDNDFIIKYYLKSRGENKVGKIVMSENKKSFVALEVNFKEIIDKLCDILKHNLVKGKVAKIDISENHILLEDSTKLKFTNIVSTIPKCLSLKFLGIKSDKLQAKHITYVKLKPDFFDLKGFDYVYVLEGNICHRITKAYKHLAGEILGVYDKKKLKEMFGNYYMDHFTIFNAQLIDPDVEILLKISWLRFVGRYGCWSRRYKTETVIEEAINDTKKKYN